MFIVLADFDLFFALEVRTFDCSLRAPALMLHNLLQIVLHLASILANVRNSFEHLVCEGVCSVFEHLPSASWTGCHVHSAVLTRDVSHWTRGCGDLPGDLEAHWTLELIGDIRDWDIIHFRTKLALVSNSKYLYVCLKLVDRNTK